MNAPDPIFAALGHALAEQERATEEAIAGAVNALADNFAAELDRRFGELPTPRDGEPGEPGLDRVLALPRHIGPAEPFERNTIAWFKAGLWQAVRAGQGDPEHDPAAWVCLVPGIAAIETREDWQARELVFAFRLASGELHETRARMLPGLLPPDWEGGVIAGDIVREGDFERRALVDNPDPVNPSHWCAREIRGRRGRDGKGLPGEPGRPGPGLVGLTLAREGNGPLCILPSYADPEVVPEPIAVDMLLGEPEPGLRPIVGFAGPYSAGKAYGRGQVVSAPGGALWLSLRPDNASPLAEGKAWERMV